MIETPDVKVVSVVLCDNCGRVMAKEEIIFLTHDQVQLEKVNNPKSFFYSVDLKNQSQYRLISTETCSIC